MKKLMILAGVVAAALGLTACLNGPPSVPVNFTDNSTVNVTIPAPESTKAPDAQKTEAPSSSAPVVKKPASTKKLSWKQVLSEEPDPCDKGTGQAVVINGGC